MTNVYAIYSTGPKAPTFKVFASEEEALNSGNGFNIVKDKTCLSDKRLFPTNTLVGLYNIKAERRISKFRDRETAESRVWKMLTESECEVTMSDNTLEDFLSDVFQKPKAKGSKRARRFAKQDAKIKSAERRIFKDKMVCVKEGIPNPRREGTHAHRSWEILKNNGPMLYQDFMAVGGRRPDFAYDLKHGWAEVCD
tara:strand:- start:5924 stop:6511 length:588 start_codon:yes stop_codon:yes gene_type:complete